MASVGSRVCTQVECDLWWILNPFVPSRVNSLVCRVVSEKLTGGVPTIAVPVGQTEFSRQILSQLGGG